MKRRLCIGYAGSRDEIAEIEVSPTGYVRTSDGPWKTVDALAVELEQIAQSRVGFASRRDHRDIVRDLAGFVWDETKKPPADR